MSLGKNFKKLILLFLIWRLALLFLGFLSERIIPDNSYLVAHLPQQIHPLLNLWVKWDGVWFYEIIKVGYMREGLTAFFPFYPLSVRLVSNFLFFFEPALVGLILSSLFLLASILVFYKLLRFDYRDDFSSQVIFYLLIFPFSLFYTLIYSESLFLLLSISAFYFARRKRWFLCGLSGFFAALTRSVGILLFIPLCLEYFYHKPKGRDSLFLLLVPVGLLTYMFFLGKTFGDPLLFLHVHKDWGRFSGNFLAGLLESLNLIKLGFLTFFFISSLILYKFIRKSYGVYVFLSILAPIISGSLMSINRCFTVLFPVYILLALVSKNHLLNWGITILFLLFLAYSTTLYVNGYWVG